MWMQNTPRRKARIRTIREVIALLKQADSQTAVTYHFIRKLCDSGCIKSIRAGKKILINYDELLAYLNLDIDEACCYGDDTKTTINERRERLYSTGQIQR